MTELDPRTIAQLEQDGALRKGWREHVDRRRRIRARFLELTRNGIGSKSALAQVAGEFSRTVKAIEKIVYGGGREDKMQSGTE